jgi:hypothetical protein
MRGVGRSVGRGDVAHLLRIANDADEPIVDVERRQQLDFQRLPALSDRALQGLHNRCAIGLR